MTLWPTVAREKSLLLQGDGTVDTNTALERGILVLTELSRIGNDVDELLTNGKSISVKPSTSQGGLVPVIFNVKDKLVTLLACHYAMYSIVTHRIVLSQLQATGDKWQDQKVLKAELMRQCRHIWIPLDYSRPLKPLGLPIMPPALMFTLDLAEGPVAQEEVVEAMNELDSILYKRKIGTRGKQDTVLAYCWDCVNLRLI
ncbi:hypothetical protein F5Y06DRAFT_301744 [Hypoxylon sp. FL0890]|nr:hypothetical protein F5Y06DRAFT_301744 [Hypoxylon sp. FL0890]